MMLIDYSPERDGAPPYSWMKPSIFKDILFKKYIRPQEQERQLTYHDWLNYSPERWALLNYRINNSENQADQCIWVLSHINSFSAADREIIVRCLDSFAHDNLSFYCDVDPTLHLRLLCSADEIRNLPANVQSIHLDASSMCFAAASFD